MHIYRRYYVDAGSKNNSCQKTFISTINTSVVNRDIANSPLDLHTNRSEHSTNNETSGAKLLSLSLLFNLLTDDIPLDLSSRY